MTLNAGKVDQTLITGRTAYGKASNGRFYPITVGSDGILPANVQNTETIQTELLACTAIAASTQVASTVLSVSGVKKALIFIDHGRAATTAFGTNGTEYRVEVNEAATGNKWRAIASVLAGSAACLAVAASADVAAAGTAVVVTSGTSIPTRGDIVFWANTVTVANSEWMRVKSVSGTASFTLENPLDNGQDSDTNIFTQGEQFALNLDVSTATRLRVLCNNQASGTTFAVYSRVACITEQ